MQPLVNRRVIAENHCSMKNLVVLLALLLSINLTVAQGGDPMKEPLLVFEQNYQRALESAHLQDKLLFIDFYTDWCAPCKELDKLVFQNDSIKELLGPKIVLLRYDAENDTIFHLSKKYHVGSYPTGIILNGEGYILNRRYGFPGDSFDSLSANVLEFVKESIELGNNNEILKGYSNTVRVNKYPSFYAEFVNRTNLKFKPAQLDEYLKTSEDLLSEEYFATLSYFASDVSDTIAKATLENIEEYSKLYGKNNVETLMYFIVSGKFKRAIFTGEQKVYDDAVEFATEALSSEWTDDILPTFEKEFLIGQNQWKKVLEINQELKSKGELENGYINYFSRQVYTNCEDEEVLDTCLQWMKDLTTEEPIYPYFSTYALLTQKLGHKEEAKRIARIAIEIGKQAGASTKAMEELVVSLSN